VTETLRVLLAVELIGLAALPLAQLALGRLALGGIAFAKPLGLLLLAWLVWMGTVLGLPNEIELLAGACGVLALAGIGAALVLRRRPEQRVPWGRLLTFEFAFAAAFAACALFNAFNPDVWQTEKPMDMAILNATAVSDGHPPHDPWMAGEDLNYYYLGQFAFGVLIRLTDVEPSAGYNLSLAVVFALAVVSAGGLAAAIAREAGRRAWLAGGVAVVLLVLAGTPGAGLDAIGANNWFSFGWFRASRVIPGTINEFPFFSFLLGDLHAHVIAGPFAVVALAFCAQAALRGPPRGLAFWERALAALAIGTLYAVNSWSFPVCAGLLLVALAAWARTEEAAGRRWSAVAHGVIVIGLGVAAVAPFLVEFEPNARGVGLVESRAGLGDFLTHHGELYGALAWVLAALYVGRVRAARHPWRVFVFSLTIGVMAVPLLAEAGIAGAGTFALLLAVALHALWSRRVMGAERAVWLLVAGGLTCLLLPEVVYVRDEFDDSDLFRMNTVFKMGYQAWYLLAIAGGCAVAMSGQWLPRVPRWGWGAGVLALVGVGLAFTVVGSFARKSGFDERPTLDGRLWLPPGDVAAIDWLRANTPGDAVVAEAVGEDYSAFGHARISTFTGRPTPMGWEGHELQWKHDPGSRREDVRRLYNSRNPREVRLLLAQLRIEYAVIGPLERTDYGDARALEVLGRKVFQRGETAIYAYDPPPEAEPAPEPTPEPEPEGEGLPPVLGGDG
jgi:YYY domain-containing protein